MRQHGHGLPSKPIIERYLGGGRWLLSGMLFNMAGTWQVAIRLSDESGDDDIVLDVAVGSSQISQTSFAQEDTSSDTYEWSAAQRLVLGSLARASLGRPQSDGSNRVADNPAAAALGKQLFFDVGLSGEGKYSCASCHQPELAFTDGLRTGVASKVGTRNTPTVLDSGFQQWLTWDGRRDSLWSQALEPIESSKELAGGRVMALRHVERVSVLREAYRNVFGEMPILEGLPQRASPLGSDSARAAWQALPPLRRIDIDTAFTNLGKAIAAYQRTLLSGESRFDHFIEAVLADDMAEADRWMSKKEQRGLVRFIDPDNMCLNCHNGPLLSNRGFQNIGTGEGEESATPDFGRLIGVQTVLIDPFNCRSAYADGASRDCDLLDSAQRTEVEALMNGAFKVPGLRNVGLTAPYMHDGRYETLEQVIRHYQQPPAGFHELRPLPDLSDDAVGEIAAFLDTLNTLPMKKENVSSGEIQE